MNINNIDEGKTGGNDQMNTFRVEEVDEVSRDEGEGALVEDVEVVAQVAVVAERVTETK